MKLFSRRTPREHYDRFFDTLEQRVVLYAPPFLADFPDTSEMANAQNTVVRMQTSQGIIDIELYDKFGPDGATAAPITTENFLRYISEGRYENVFFHRLAFKDGGTVPFVLQGGGFRFDAPSASVSPIDTFATILNEFDPGRSNVERTLAMAKLGHDPNSATSQFFVNLSDNAANLDVQNEGFTVFARVISGWEIVQTITTFTRQNLNSVYPGGQGALDEVPLSAPGSTNLITILDVDVIKPGSTIQFYDHAIYFPDGFRSGNSSGTVNLVNLDVNEQAHYEVIVRFETGQRDRVISSGTLTPGAHLSIPVYRAQDANIDHVRGGAFAFEIRATKPVAASITHSDFNATTTETFINPRDFDAADLHEWTFAMGLKGTGIPSFLVWQNLSDQEAALMVTFIAENGDTFDLGQSLHPFRRGGLDVNLLPGVPAGAYSVKITSTQPIVAALSQYRIAPGRAAIESGSLAGGAAEGVLPGAYISGDGQSILSVALHRSVTEPVIVDFEFILADGSVITSPSLFTLSNDNRRQDADLFEASGVLPSDELFTIRYSVRDGVTPITASYLGLLNGQTMRSAFQTVSGQEVFFAGGMTDPEAGEGAGEFISIYNPHLDPDVTVEYRLRFHFVSDPAGEIILPFAGVGTLAPGQSVHINVRELNEVMQRINAGTHFQIYGITVSADIQKDGQETPGAIFAQYTRLHPTAGTSTMGPTLGTEFPRFFLNDPIFGG
jgi:cyclophilin family peptidyl-prolyl cis-trans isomerase